MADDTIWNYVNDFINGAINREQFWALAKFRHPTHQISFHTLRPLDCLTFEQVSSEIIEQYKIPNGDFDTITNCKYSIPSFMDIGHLYAYLIDNLAYELKDSYQNMLIKIFNSFLSDEISNFKTGIYFENLSFLQESFKAGRLLLD